MWTRFPVSLILISIAFSLSACAKQADEPSTSVSPEPVVEGTPTETKAETPIVPEIAAADTEPAAVKFEYHNPLSKEEQEAGWLSLFDGVTLFGWESTSDEINWSVQDGAIVADSGPIGFLLTKVPFADYELVCEYRMEKGGNSGLFLRCDNPPGDISTNCYEVNIADEHPDGFTTGSIVNRKKVENPIERNDGWNEFRVTVDGHALKVVHNGVEVAVYTAEGNVAPIGRIGLQKNSGKIEFRKVLVKPLNLESMFNGTDLAGWRNVPGSKSEFTVESGEIHVKNGQGFIETEKTYQDFIFQSQAISHAAELNSGFFFRAMPGTEEAPSNGYEYQIHNGFDGDRSKPNNAGTGAIFRRVEARYVVANDKEWFTATLIASGPRIACFVDGYQVVDWEDTRAPDPNPRKGRRLEGGHISLQGHDPTTDLSFKNLRIAEFSSLSPSDE